MTYLLDTNVVSELRRPGKTHPAVRAWAGAFPIEQFFLSVISILEIEIGIRALERRDFAQAKPLRAWLEGRVLPQFDGRLIALDLKIARRCAELHVPDRLPERDAMIAATALTHNLVLVTRNEKDFRATGVVLLNPWA